jgi:CheY-like chemotaxis protein
LINDTLDFSKIEANRLELETIDFDLRAVFQETFESFVYQAKDKGLDLILETKFSSGVYLKGDPARLRQILNNLLSNAIKFNEKGEIRLRADLQVISSSETMLAFEVVDTGIGIKECAMQKLFQSFSQADTSTTRRFGGTGLGLSICKGLAQLMKGEIGVKSRPGEGSTFWLKIPFQIGEKPAQRRETSLRPGLIQKAAQRMLVVDDNPINQKVAILILQKLGQYADGVANGSEALKILERIPYNLILMDCQMPEMDGFETTRRIRSHQVENLRKIPIIAMTANAIKGDREKCIESGMNDYVAKPLRLDELCAAINHCL